jgi:ATP-dependent helicase/nuclease subunit B
VLDDLTAVTAPNHPDFIAPEPGISSAQPASLPPHGTPDGVEEMAHEIMGDLTLEKDLGMLAALREVLVKGLSPTGLNEYLNCSLKFYFNRIARFREAEEVEEALGADGFGTVVHEVLEELLAPFQRNR